MLSKKGVYILPFAFSLLLLSLFSCIKDEDYTTSPADVLVFSQDTVAFDTIISGTATNTYTFTVYNRSKKAIRIPRVYLESGTASPFGVNVDGMPLTDGQAEDFEIAAKDSMIVFLMANVAETDSDDPVPVSDKLMFQTEAGVLQEVVLTASGQAVIPLEDCHITENTIFASRRPYRIMDSIVVEENATLLVAPGTKMYFHHNAELIVKGCLKIEGTLDAPVILRGDRTGNMFAGQPYDRIPGQWGGIIIKSPSHDNYISYADIHSGNFGIRVDSTDITKRTLVMENSVIHNTTHTGLDVRMANVYAGNSQLTNSGGNCVQIRGGDVTLVHCTVARFFVFTGGSGVALDFANYDGNVRLPLNNLTVANTIITGYQNDELMGSQNMDYEKDAFNYVFQNCLINTPETDEENPRLIDCLLDITDKNLPNDEEQLTREKNFTPEPDLKSLIFSFIPAQRSKATGHADEEITAITYPQDRLGRSRASGSDIGCYQHMEEE